MTAGVAGFGVAFALGAVLAAAALRRRPPWGADSVSATEPLAEESCGSAPSEPQQHKRATTHAGFARLWVVQAVATAGGIGVGWWATRLWGMSVLVGGLGALLPPFVAAPARRRRQTAEALAWQTWTRQLAELARSGAGLGDALAASTEHAPPQIADTVTRAARTARLVGLRAAMDELAALGRAWEPEVAAGLRIAASSGGPLAGPLGDLAGRIGDIVALHRTRTEAVVQLWTQTIALLALAGAVLVLMYRNNPAYFEPYRTPTGQAVLLLIAFVLLGATAFLVRHSVVRAEPSALVAPERTRRAPDPL
ncbi:type II secretion system F family protein [Candidatus Poriferisodalis sp.]|uniref:type II secretion system F family protein n=1 Tax=Candidatus Poriferisodalis sp. TaxID=3101277 RepID=UPI003B017ABC